MTIKTRIIIALFSLCFLFSAANLNAGWGRTDKVIEFDDIEWDQVFYKMNGLHFTSYMPGYDGANLEDTEAFITGYYAGAVYIISTDIEATYTMPRTEREFIKIFDDSSSECKIIPINAKPFGAKYCIEMIPLSDDDTVYVRVIATNSHLIHMYTNDINQDSRDYFFNSLKVHPR